MIINFFAAWSPPCKAETRLLATFYRLYNHYDGKVLIIGVDSRDSRAAALRLLRASGVTYPVASDPTLAVAGKYGVPGLPTTYFLNAQHQIVKTNLGWLNWHKLREGVAAMDTTSIRVSPGRCCPGPAVKAASKAAGDRPGEPGAPGLRRRRRRSRAA